MLTENLPQWDNSDEYKGFTTDDFQQDYQQVEKFIFDVNKLTKEILTDLEQPEKIISENLKLALQKILSTRTQSYILIYNLYVYCSTEKSVNVKNHEAVQWLSKTTALRSQLSAAYKASDLYLTLTTDENLNKILSAKEIEDYKFQFKNYRKQKDFMLSAEEEKLITLLAPSGHNSWENLYAQLSGTMEVPVEQNGKTEIVTVAQAAGIIFGFDPEKRKAAWIGLQKAWKTHQESAAYILNSIASWRHAVNNARSKKVTTDFLDLPLQLNRIEQKSLEAMLAAIEEVKPQLQQAIKTMAKHMGKAKLGPWDLLAPAPIKGKSAVTFTESFNEVKESFTKFNPEMGQFTQMMLDRKWIDASVRPNKENGGYCTSFAKSGNPRVFQSFVGTDKDTGTLAHELGHAYHAWVMRDMNKIAYSYTSALAETASIFSEQVYYDYNISHAKSNEEKLSAYWTIVQGAVSLLLNIPTRFDFEKSFYEKSKNGFVSSEDLSKLMEQAYEKWYGDSISEYEPMFWATKMHFSFARTSFYNFPYTFGYLFSLGIYAYKDQWGADFSKKYIEILRDTGKMNAEEIVKKHLNEDIAEKEFWKKSLNVVLEKINVFNAIPIQN